MIVFCYASSVKSEFIKVNLNENNQPNNAENL